MTFVCDEGVDRLVVQRLREDGHEVVYIAEMSPNVSDETVLGEANRLHAPVITRDKDFGDSSTGLGAHRRASC